MTQCLAIRPQLSRRGRTLAPADLHGLSAIMSDSIIFAALLAGPDTAYDATF